MKQIVLTQGKVAIVDDEDFDVLSAVKWHAYLDWKTFYAMRNALRPDGKRTKETMHRVVLARKLGRAVTDGMHTDHANGDGLDNRRENLHEVTCAQNQRNCRHAENASSRYLGVYWHKRDKKWGAYIVVNRHQISLGYQDTELAAAQAREAFIVAHPELHARSNFG